MLSPRLWTVNISTSNQSTVQTNLGILLGSGSPEPLTLSELSVYRDQDEQYYNELPPEESYIFPLNSIGQESFEKLTRRLSVLRIRRAQFYWDRFNFSHSLNELHLQEINFGYDSAVAEFLRALSSASNLHILKLISVRSFYRRPLHFEPPVKSKIWLRNLRFLLVDDLYFSTLERVLSSIVCRSHRLTILLSNRCQYIDHSALEPPGVKDTIWESLCGLLIEVPVKELFVAGDRLTPWPSPLQFEKLMEATAPGLEALRMNLCDFDTTCCKVLVHRLIPQNSSEPTPTLAEVRLTRARIPDQEVFVGMVLSHSSSIQHLILGAAVRGEEGVGWAPLEEDHPLASTLEKIIPKFQLVDCDVMPSEFEDAPCEWLILT
ncbi:hypothetical protein B0J17DRAFT_632286 [Rhizoctonia solani]|nr:hypothetical protein B0J17DRAFT_632286 [Rhizoctonia solani]